MSDVLSFNPPVVNECIRFDGGPFTPPAVRARGGMPQLRVIQLNTRGGSAEQTLAKVGGAEWLTVPGGCYNGVVFNVSIDAAALAPGRYHETITVSENGFEDGTLQVNLLVVPAGGPARRGRG